MSKFPVLRSGLDSIVESSTLAINQKVASLRSNAKKVYHFGFGESPFPVPPALEKALSDNAHRKSYLPTQGLPTLREAVARYYNDQFGYDYHSRDVLVGPGSKELLFQLLFMLEGPLLLPAPSWVSYGPQAQLCGKRVVLVPAHYEQCYQITAEALDQACRKCSAGQKILILNSPNNPTGQCMDEDTARALAAICRREKVVVISDEIYALTQHKAGALASVAHYYPEGTVVTGGLSKAFSAGGYRLGLALLPAEMSGLRDALIKSISETFSAVSAPIQYAALAVYGDFDSVAGHVKACTSIHALAGEFLHQRFVDMGLRCLAPTGGFYLFPDFSGQRKRLKAGGIADDKALSNALLSRCGIATLPGSDFNMQPDSFCLRIASVDYDGARVFVDYTAGERNPSVLFSHMGEGCDRMAEFLNTI